MQMFKAIPRNPMFLQPPEQRLAPSYDSISMASSWSFET